MLTFSLYPQASIEALVALPTYISLPPPERNQLLIIHTQWQATQLILKLSEYQLTESELTEYELTESCLQLVTFKFIINLFLIFYS